MKILLFGKQGQVGWELERSLAPLGQVIALDREGDGTLCGDLTNRAGLAGTVRRVKPDVIVNAAAYTAVDKAEFEPEMAQRINGFAPGILADEAQELGAWLVHFSSDYVFDGRGEKPWQEGDATGPLSIYGKSKLQGEQAVARCSKHLIFRSSWVYAARGQNFAKTMLQLAYERDHLRVVNDQIGAPTGAELVADVTAHALRVVQKSPERAGIYHLVAGGSTSWLGYAQYIVEQAQRAKQPVRATPETVHGIPTSDYPTPAQRPLNSRLDTKKLQAAFGVSLPAWQSGVARVLAELFERD